MEFTQVQKLLSGEKILTPFEVNQIAREVLESLTFKVKGEVFELKRDKKYTLVYFGLKDEKGRVKCIASHYLIDNLDFELKDGMEIIVLAQLTVYEMKGEFQLRVLEASPVGKGSLYEELEKLKAKLHAEGIFDSTRKKPLPEFPEKIGVITSEKGEGAWKDVLKVIKERFPAVELVLVDVMVEGKKAVAQIVKALEVLNQREDIDLIILTRGGGSFEDFMPFNTEEVAKAVANSHIPVICAIGHEKDVSIAELAADKRAPTPTYAAQLAVKDKTSLLQRIDELMEKIEKMKKFPVEYQTKLKEIMGIIRQRIWFHLELKKKGLLFLESKIEEFGQKFKILNLQLENLKEKIQRSYLTLLEHKKKDLNKALKLIELLDPYRLLQKGYTITYNREGKLITSIKDIQEEEIIFTQFKEGKVKSKVLKKLI